MRSPLTRGASVITAATLVFGLTSCGGGDGGSTGPEAPASVALAMGGDQSATVGERLAVAIGIKVTTSAGKPLAGVPVNFSAAANSGRVSAGTATTNAGGIASVTWTLGPRAGADIDTVRASVSQHPDLAVVVTASATAAAPASLSVVSGGEQIGEPGQPVAEPLVVLVHDAFGNPNAGVAVQWSVAGGGTISATEDTTDALGKASVVWTLGAGSNEVSATVAAIPDAKAAFSASLTVSGVVELLAISPDSLVEGQSATLSGTGFSATLADNKVWVDGMVAPVTAASATSLQITVPTFDCQPARDVPVRVAVGSDGSNVVERPLAVASAPVSLAVGEQLIVRDSKEFCLQFAAELGYHSYLVGVQSTSDMVGSMTPVILRAVQGSNPITPLHAAPLPAPAPSLIPRSAGRMIAPPMTPTAQRWLRHRGAEARLRARERRLVTFRTGAAVAAFRARAPISVSNVPGTVQVGDTIPIRFPDVNGADFCDTSIPITTVVRAIGTRGIWLEDIANPEGGYTPADFQSLSDVFDARIYATDVAYFGEPTDHDGNGRVVIVTSKEVNKVEHVLGFVVSSDLVPISQCAASNEGEFYYGRAPDVTGIYESPAPYSLELARADAQILIAHEFTHVIQFGRRASFPSATAFQTSWEAEGQATFAQEVVGHDINGREPGNNYGFDIAFNTTGSSEVNWYEPTFTDLAVYYGFRSASSRAPGAPEECSWLGTVDEGNDGPCLHGREVYGVPALFLRWLSDQFGPTFPGGEQGLHRALIDNAYSGFATIESVVHVPMDLLLAQWAATLYLDDRLAATSSRLKMPSWNLAGIASNLVPTATLIPLERGFYSFTHAMTVRGGSAAYFQISGTSGPATALGLRDASGNTLPSTTSMQLWIVRLE